METNYINTRDLLEKKIFNIIEKLKIEVKSILELWELWETGPDIEKNKDKIYKILDNNWITEWEIVFQKVTVFKSWDNKGFIDFSKVWQKVDQKNIINQFNASWKWVLSKSKCRLARNELEIQNIIWLQMNSWIIMPFTTNKDTYIMLDWKNQSKFVNFRTLNWKCNIIKYENLLKIYNLLWISYFEYNN